MKNEKRYGVIFFDADDTLLDFQKDAGRAFRAALRSIGRCDEETVRTCVEYDFGHWDRIGLAQTHLPGVQENFHRMYTDHVREIFIHAEEVCGLGGRADEAEAAFLEAFSAPGHPLGRAKEVVAELHTRYRVFAATNGIARLQRGRLREFALDGVIVSEELGVIKPTPAFFERALACVGAAREECLMVGDSMRTDIRGANAAGIDCVWFDPAHCPCPEDVTVQAHISDLSELLRIL